MSPAGLSKSHFITEDQDQEENGSWAGPPDPPLWGFRRVSGDLRPALKVLGSPEGTTNAKTQICHLVLHKRTRKVSPYLETKDCSGSALIKM